MPSRQPPPVLPSTVRRILGAAQEAASTAIVAQATADGAVLDAADAQSTADEAIVLAGLAFEGATLKNGTLTTSASAGAITISIKTAAGLTPSVGDSVDVVFTDQSSTRTTISVSAAKTITIPSTATLATPTGQAFRIWVVAMLNNAGTDFELAVVNRIFENGTTFLKAYMIPDHYLYGNQLPIAVISTGATSAGKIYTSTSIASASRPMRILGSLLYESGATPGTWVNPTQIVLSGRGVLLPGALVQSGYHSQNSGSTQTISVALPVDNTRPNFVAGEFDFWNNVDITPESATNYVEIEFDGYVCAPTGATTSDTIAMGVGIANSDWWTMGFARSLGADIPQRITFRAPIRFAVGGLFQNNYNIGLACTKTGTAYINRNAAGALFGGASIASIRISEFVS